MQLIREDYLKLLRPYYDVDLILTGDKDFAAVVMDKPEVITPKEYVEQYLI